MVADSFVARKSRSSPGGGVSRLMTSHDGDLELIQRLVRGDKLALEALFATYGQRLYAYALRLTDDPAQAEDAVQEALIAAWRSARNYRAEGRIIAWLLGIVHHATMTSLRHRIPPLPVEAAELLPANTLSPEEAIQEKERSHWIQSGLDSLSVEHRAVIELVFYQKLSLQEVARVCSCPVGTVKSRLSYARRHLRGILARQGLGSEEAG